MLGTESAAGVRRLLIAVAVALLAAGPVATTAGAQNGESPGYEDYYQHDDGAETGGESRAPRVQLTDGALYEWIVVGPVGEAAAVRAAIEAAGGRVIRDSTLGALGQTTTIATFPSEAQRERAEAAIAQLAPGSSLSWHHLYNFAQASNPRIYAPVLIGDAAPGRCRLAAPVDIGMIDGPVNTEHPALRGVNVTYETLVPRSAVPVADHGTAVAVLLVQMVALAICK